MQRKALTPQKGFLPFLTCKSERVTFPSSIFKNNSEKPNILIICAFSIFSGLETHCLEQYKSFLKNGYNAQIIIPKNSVLEKKLIEENLSFYCYSNYNLFAVKSFFFKAHRQPGLSKAIEQIVKKHNINIIHCNRAKDSYLLKNIKNLSIKTILTRHAASLIRKKYIKKFNGIIGVDSSYVLTTKKKQLKNNKNFPITEITPFFKEPKIQSNNTSKKEFFNREFGININNDHPILVIVGALSRGKNHALLFKAIRELTYTKNKPINLLICGNGKLEKHLKSLANKLKINNIVYFLGFTDKRIEVMFHSDIKVLTSKKEAFGIVLAEAALLKKPLIGTKGTGMENVIKHEKTGLLFESENTNDLANKIEKLIDNPNLQKEYGLNAYNHVKNNFTSDILIKKLEEFYTKI